MLDPAARRNEPVLPRGQALLRDPGLEDRARVVHEASLTPLAAIFDLDGLLIDSEPFWQRAEMAVFATVGITLTPALCRTTAGLRVDEVVRHWHARQPWSNRTLEEVAHDVVEHVAFLMRSEGAMKPGVAHALALARERGLRLALASASSRYLIGTALARLGLEDVFEFVHSGEDETHGKPHPAIYLSTAASLGIDPTRAVALEDSLNGVIAAKAARMRCIAVPEWSDARFALADYVVPSLENVTPGMFA